MGKIVIFGATGAIGSSIAKLLSGKDEDLHLVARDEIKLNDLSESLNASSTAGDVLDETLFERVAQDAGKVVDGLVYAVGTLNLKNINRLTSEDFLTDFKVNALGAALAVQALTPALKKGDNQASVVLFSSVAVNQGFKFHASLGMAKGAVQGLGLSLAADLAPDVRVNVIAPSLTKTPLAAGLLENPKMAQAIAKLHPMERLGEAEDIAVMANFLLSDEASWITGQIFGVDGGRSTLRIKS